jgi:chromosome segregation ATPase
LSPKRKANKNILLKQLEKLLGTFSDDMITTLDLKDEKKALLKKLSELKREEVHLQDMVDDLERTRDKQAVEIRKRESEEQGLMDRVSILKDEKADMESDKITLNQQIDALKREKEELNSSLERTNDLLVRFRAHIEEFDEELKS